MDYSFHWLEYKLAHGSSIADRNRSLSVLKQLMFPQHFQFRACDRDEAINRANYRSTFHEHDKNLHLFFGNAHNTIHLVVTGNGCYELDRLRIRTSLSGYDKWFAKLLVSLKEIGCRAQRLDSKQDSLDTSLTAKLIECSEAKQRGTFWQGTLRSRVVKTRNVGSDTPLYEIKYGNPANKNGSFVRAYDDRDRKFCRVELVVKGEPCEEFATNWLRFGEPYVRSYLEHRLVFRDYSERYKTRPDRAPVSEFWLPFVEGGIRVDRPKVVPVADDDFSQKFAWFLKTLGPWQNYFLSRPDGISLFVQMRQAGRMKQKQIDASEEAWRKAPFDKTHLPRPEDLKCCAHDPFLQVAIAMLAERGELGVALERGRQLLMDRGLVRKLDNVLLLNDRAEREDD